MLIFILVDGSGGREDISSPEYGSVDQYIYRVQPIDRKRLMLVLADLEYILVRATHGQAVNVVG